MFDERRLYSHIDWLLLGAVLILTAIGLAMIASATWNPIRGRVGPQFWTQLYAAGIGIFALLVALTIDYRRLCENSLAIYIAVGVLLLYVLFFGTTRRWISLGIFNLQPSEFMKIALALALATFFAENNRGAQNNGNLLLAGAFVGIAFLLIAKEPDLGSAVTMLPIFLGITFVAGLRLKLLAVFAAVAIVTAPLAWTFALKDYQKSRIQTFLDPQQDSQGAGYQQIQAKISVGTGGLTGKGFLQGTQGQYKFLPVAHNDFIYSVLAEEQGFLGVLGTLGLYLFVGGTAGMSGALALAARSGMAFRSIRFRTCVSGYWTVSM